MAKRFVYQDSITGEKFSFDVKKPRSNPENNVRLVFMGEEGTKEADRDIRKLTFQAMQEMLIECTTLAELESLGQVQVPEKMTTDEQRKKLSDLYHSRHNELLKVDKENEGKERQARLDRENKIADDVIAKIRGAKSLDELTRIHEAGRAIEGVGSDVAVKADDAYRKRYEELKAR